MRLPLGIILLTALATFVACHSTPQKRLTDVDAELKASRARRNYVLETDAQAQTQGLSQLSGKWETRRGNKRESKTLRYRRRGSQSTSDPSAILVLTDAVYTSDCGLTLTFNRPVKLIQTGVTEPLCLFRLKIGTGFYDAEDCFEPKPGKDIEVSRNKVLLPVCKKKSCDYDLSEFDVEPKEGVFGLAWSPSATGTVSLWEAPVPKDPCDKPNQ